MQRPRHVVDKAVLAEAVRRAVSKSHRVLPSQRKASYFGSAFRKHTAPEALKQQEACAMSADFIRIQVVPRTDSSALNTVSYTHLEVYKRQPLQSLSPS